MKLKYLICLVVLNGLTGCSFLNKKSQIVNEFIIVSTGTYISKSYEDVLVGYKNTQDPKGFIHLGGTGEHNWAIDRDVSIYADSELVMNSYRGGGVLKIDVGTDNLKFIGKTEKVYYCLIVHRKWDADPDVFVETLIYKDMFAPGAIDKEINLREIIDLYMAEPSTP